MKRRTGPSLEEGRIYQINDVVTRQIFGWIAVFGSTFFFYLATLIIRWSQAYVEISSAYFVFARFLLGFLVVASTMVFNNQRLQPRRYHYLVGRTFANTVAVFCFYKAVEVGSVAEANILNMTYPLFVALLIFTANVVLGRRRSRSRCAPNDGGGGNV